MRFSLFLSGFLKEDLNLIALNNLMLVWCHHILYDGGVLVSLRSSRLFHRILAISHQHRCRVTMPPKIRQMQKKSPCFFCLCWGFKPESHGYSPTSLTIRHILGCWCHHILNFYNYDHSPNVELVQKGNIIELWKNWFVTDIMSKMMRKHYILINERNMTYHKSKLC